MSLPLCFGLLYFSLLAIINYTGGYGIFVDEFYYLACAKRLAWGYVDQPPLSIFLLNLFQISGESVFFLRIIPAAFAGLSVFLVGNLADRFNGNRLSVSLACIATMTVPVLQVIFGFYSMNAIEIFFVILLVTLVLKLKEDPIQWISIGVVIGLGIMNKHTFSVYVLAVLVPYFILNFKSILRTKTFYIGVLTAIIIISPNLYWQYVNSFPSLEFYKNAYSMKNINLGLIQIIFDQILSQNPATLPLWLCGIYFFLKNKELRFIGFAYLLLIGFFLYSKSSRPDRIAAFYPILFAGGGAFFLADQWKKIILGLTLLVGLFLSPIGLPILPLHILSNYVNALGIVPQIEAGNRTLLPQWFADRLDWKEFHLHIQSSIDSLDLSEKKETVVLGNYYGQAGSLEFYKIPIPVISGHNNYFLWLDELKIVPKNLIVTGEEPILVLENLFEEKRLIGKYSRNYTTEKDIPIYLLKKSKSDLTKMLPSLKSYR
ncbi:glycosyltransferase family 39 protein [Leptospira ilyithenensis]|nr:glycosyltransferase family 39 protein [Leptospira ilyithenensis]